MNNFNPHISVDCVVFGFDEEELRILLISRSREDKPGSAKLKLPGDLIIRKEELHNSAARVLKEYTGIDKLYLKQFGVFDDPDRLNSDEDLNWLKKRAGVDIDRVITIAFYSLVKIDLSKKTDLSIAYKAQWYKLNEIPGLIFDHKKIIQIGLQTLRRELLTEPLCFELLPKKFTLNQLQKVYESILGVTLDNRNFRKKINKIDYIKPLNERQTGVSHKPAMLYGFDNKIFDNREIEHTGFII